MAALFNWRDQHPLFILAAESMCLLRICAPSVMILGQARSRLSSPVEGLPPLSVPNSVYCGLWVRLEGKLLLLQLRSRYGCTRIY